MTKHSINTFLYTLLIAACFSAVILGWFEGCFTPRIKVYNIERKVVVYYPVKPDTLTYYLDEGDVFKHSIYEGQNKIYINRELQIRTTAPIKILK